MGFNDDKRDGLDTDSELDPVDEILKRINESKADLPDDLQAAEPVVDEIDVDEDDAETEAEDLQNTLDESDRCVRCEKRRRDTSIAEDYEFCDRCHEEMLRAPLKWQSFVVAFFAIIAAGIAFVVLVFTFPTAQSVMEAKSFERQNRLVDALGSYYEAQDNATQLNQGLNMENLFTAGTKTFVKQMKLTAKVQSPLSVGQMLSEMIKNEKSYKNLWLKKLKPYNETFIKFQNTQEAVQPIVATYQEAEPQMVPYDDLIAELEALKTGENAADYEDYFIEYYKTYIAVLADKGPLTELEHMLAVKELAPKETWLFNLYIADCYNRLEKYDEMMAVCDEMIAENANNLQAYLLKARVYSTQKEFDKAIAVSEQMNKANPNNPAVFALSAEIYRRKGDIEKAASVCAEGLEKVEGGGTELYRQQAIVLLLRDDKKAAYEAADNAYNSAYYNQDTTVELINTVALCASLAGETETYEEMIEFLEQNGVELADSVVEIIAGTKTLKDVFIDGKGDVL